jgi:hypothetical protein
MPESKFQHIRKNPSNSKCMSWVDIRGLWNAHIVKFEKVVCAERTDNAHYCIVEESEVSGELRWSHAM